MAPLNDAYESVRANPAAEETKKNERHSQVLNRADEAEELLSAVSELIVNFIRAADIHVPGQNDQTSNINDNNINSHNSHPPQHPKSTSRTTLLDQQTNQDLKTLLSTTLPLPSETPLGKDGALSAIRSILEYSVNTWSQGFLDKLYSATSPIGVTTELVLGVLNTNVHVYAVSPALTVVEKRVGSAIARVFGFEGARAGALAQPGGSAANLSSMVVARNCLFPETKEEGVGGRRFVAFTSAHGHYSVEKAAQMIGLGAKGAGAVGVDGEGRMVVAELERLIRQAREAGETPFYVNATAGTTVLGSVDPLEEIAEVCEREGLWMHVDASWGGGMAFSPNQRLKLKGIQRANSITFSPHKMLGVPLTCSFLVGRDLRDFHKGMTLPAGYLFHSQEEEDEAKSEEDTRANGDHISSAPKSNIPVDEEDEFWDLGDLVPQCGRRGDALKFALTWIYSGSTGLAAHVDQGFAMAALLATLVAEHPRFTLVSENPPPCLQVCFYFDKAEVNGQESESNETKRVEAAKKNTRMTQKVVRGLLHRGFMVDYAPGDEGKFLRVVVNGQTSKQTVESLVRTIEEVGLAVKV